MNRIRLVGLNGLGTIMNGQPGSANETFLFCHLLACNGVGEEFGFDFGFVT